MPYLSISCDTQRSGTCIWHIILAHLQRFFVVQRSSAHSDPELAVDVKIYSHPHRTGREKHVPSRFPQIIGFTTKKKGKYNKEWSRRKRVPQIQDNENEKESSDSGTKPPAFLVPIFWSKTKTLNMAQAVRIHGKPSNWLGSKPRFTHSNCPGKGYPVLRDTQAPSVNFWDIVKSFCLMGNSAKCLNLSLPHGHVSTAQFQTPLQFLSIFMWIYSLLFIGFHGCVSKIIFHLI